MGYFVVCFLCEGGTAWTNVSCPRIPEWRDTIPVNIILPTFHYNKFLQIFTIFTYCVWTQTQLGPSQMHHIACKGTQIVLCIWVGCVCKSKSKCKVGTGHQALGTLYPGQLVRPRPSPALAPPLPGATLNYVLCENYIQAAAATAATTSYRQPPPRGRTQSLMI